MAWLGSFQEQPTVAPCQCLLRGHLSVSWSPVSLFCFPVPPMTPLDSHIPGHALFPGYGDQDVDTFREGSILSTTVPFEINWMLRHIDQIDAERRPHLTAQSHVHSFPPPLLRRSGVTASQQPCVLHGECVPGHATAGLSWRMSLSLRSLGMKGLETTRFPSTTREGAGYT